MVIGTVKEQDAPESGTVKTTLFLQLLIIIRLRSLLRPLSRKNAIKTANLAPAPSSIKYNARNRLCLF